MCYTFGVMNNKKTVAVLGAGNMGTALSYVLADNGHEVKIWNWEGDLLPLKQIAKEHENKKYLPGIKLPENIEPCEKISQAVEGASVVFFVVPSGVMEHTISFVARSIRHDAVLVDVSKGIEPHSLQLIPNIISKHVRPGLRKNIVTISGPAIARQMAEEKYTMMNIAGKNKRAIARVCRVLENKYIKLAPTTDVIGVEVGGSFKNVYAIAMGICDGLKLGLNIKAALLVRALAEIGDLIRAMGGKKQTAYELAGLGDLIGTGLCDDSRNRQFGEYLGRGLTSAAALKKVKQTVEGVPAVHALLHLAEKHKIETPFAQMVYNCLSTKGDPRRIMTKFLQGK